MPIVVTAGHVDHGKSALVRGLTGMDPDRWAEERDRGLTIDLGFAWTEIAGHEVGFVDVPGHEKFIKNMLAGVGAVDCALFVVAADSGWMPQSEEHAAVLDLLDVDRGVIALTRIDLVDDDTRDLAMLEVLEEVSGTCLEGWPVVPVSPVTGDGLTEMRAAIGDTLERAAARPRGAFRMWVDRAFRPHGAGLVVTGTVMSGVVSDGDEAMVYPAGSPVKVRGIQRHDRPVDSSPRGSRTALNLSGAPGSVGRGDLVAEPGAAVVTDRFLAWFRPTRTLDAIPGKGAFHLHLGTASRPVRLRRIGDGAFLVHMDEAVPAIMGDRVILRDTGRRAVVGGGIVIDPVPVARPTAADAQTLRSAVDGGPAAMADALVAVHGSMEATVLTSATGDGRPTEAIRAGPTWLAPTEVRRIGAELVEMTRAHHSAYPIRPGLPKGEAASRIGVATEVVDVVTQRTGGLVADAGAVRLAGFEPTIDAASRTRWERVRAEVEASFDVPRESSLDLDDEVVHYLVRTGELVRVADDLVFTARQVEQISDRVAELPDGFTVAEFRDHFGMARRQAVPTLEWLDATGRTRRVGDGRSVRR